MKTKLNIRALALAGARVRLGELALERAQLLRAFPAILPGMPTETIAHAVKPQRKLAKRRKMSAAARRAVSKRMRAYWRKRRKVVRMRQVSK